MIPTLKSMGLSKQRIESTLRFSFSAETTMSEIDYCIDTLEIVLKKLRLYVGK